MEIYFVTTNDLKFAEIARIVPTIKQLKIKLDEIQSLDIDEIIQFKIKQALREVKDRCILVDDTSVYFEAFDYQLPGPFIRFFLSTLGCSKLFQICSSIGKLGARAITTLGFFHPDRGIDYFKGEVSGNIVRPVIDSRSNWDPLFCPDGEKESFYELGPEGKAKHSMRKKALDQLLARLGC